MSDATDNRYICMARPRLAAGKFAIETVQTGHIEAIRRWRNAQIDVLRQPEPISPMAQQRYFAEHIWPEMAAQQPRNILVSFLEDGHPIGYGGLVHIAWHDKRAEVSFLLDTSLTKDPEAETAYLQTFLRLIKTLAFEDLGLEKLTAEIYATRKLYWDAFDHAGFSREGHLLRHIRIGCERLDAVLFGCHRPPMARPSGHAPAGAPVQIEMHDICRLSPEQQMAIRDIRNQDSVRRFVVSDHLIGEDEHRTWLASLPGNSRQKVYALLRDGQPVGVGSLSGIDRRNLTAEWGFFVDEAARGGLGAALKLRLIEVAFGPLGLRKLNATVIETNPAGLESHLRFGFVEEGFRRNEIERDGHRVGLHVLGLTAQDWDNRREAVVDGLAEVFGRVSLSPPDPD